MRAFAVGILVALSAVACGTSSGGGTASSEDAIFDDACPALSHPDFIQTERVALPDIDLQVRVGTMGPGPNGDVLFLHGFADRLDNHRPLFQGFVDAGYRVIAFDYPSHGETCGRNLERFNFTDLANLAGRIERLKGSAGKPLYVAGWSTGGLLAVRMAQGLGQRISPSALSRPIAGLALLAPGVDVKTVVHVTASSLTRNPDPPHFGAPSPSSPLTKPLFSAALLTNTFAAATSLDVPALVITGGDSEDQYVDTEGVKSWVEARRGEGASIAGYTCAGGYHELDNEPEPMGGAVRTAMREFLGAARDFSANASGGCTPY